MKRRYSRIILFSLCMIGVLALVAAPASAQQYPTCAESQPIPPGWSYSPPSGPPGTLVYIVGAAGTPSADFFIYYQGTGELVVSFFDEEIVDNVHYIGMVPMGTPPGTYDIVVRDNQGETSYCASWTVTPLAVQQEAYAPAETAGVTTLPRTGYMLLIPAAGLAAAGTGAVLSKRRGRR